MAAAQREGGDDIGLSRERHRKGHGVRILQCDLGGAWFRGHTARVLDRYFGDHLLSGAEPVGLEGDNAGCVADAYPKAGYEPRRHDWRQPRHILEGCGGRHLSVRDLLSLVDRRAKLDGVESAGKPHLDRNHDGASRRQLLVFGITDDLLETAAG